MNCIRHVLHLTKWILPVEIQSRQILCGPIQNQKYLLPLNMQNIYLSLVINNSINPTVCSSVGCVQSNE